MKLTRIRRNFAIILGVFCLSALTPLLVPFSMGSNGSLNGVGYLTGILFWIGLLGGIAGYIVLYRKEKKHLADIVRKEQAEARGGAQKTRQKPRALYFFSNSAARITDSVMILALVGTLYSVIDIRVPSVLAIASLTLALAGIYAHFLLNGKLFQYLIWNGSDKESIKGYSEAKEGVE